MNTDPQTEALIDALVRMLIAAIGPDHGITIDTLTQRLHMRDRRATEQLIQHNLSRIPCTIVADTNGLYRPTKAEQINAYIHNLRQRHQPLKTREEITISKALAEHWPQEGFRFVDPPERKELELFTC